MTTIDEYETKLKELREDRKKLQKDLIHTVIWISGFGMFLMLASGLFLPHFFATIVFIATMLSLLYILIYFHVFDGKLFEKITWMKGAISAANGYSMDYGLEQLVKK